tara:strand:+ start:863 stop:1447 length:585 start_codon:yes stop_codon:yes gene_type:complete
MLAVFSLVSDGLIVQRAAAPLAAPPAVSRATMPSAGLFDMFKESDESKAAKEAEWKAIQDAQRRRLDPNAMDEYKDSVEERRLAQMAARKEEEEKLTSGNYEVVGFAEKVVQLPPGWTAVQDGEGDTYYVRSHPRTCPLLTSSCQAAHADTLTDATPCSLPVCAVEPGDGRHAVGCAERVGKLADVACTSLRLA